MDILFEVDLEPLIFGLSEHRPLITASSFFPLAFGVGIVFYHFEPMEGMACTLFIHRWVEWDRLMNLFSV
jgi:hypothetical protein